jgi:hypothetical protein
VSDIARPTKPQRRGSGGALESDYRDLFETLDTPTRSLPERLWRERLGRLSDADFRYRDRVAYVSGRRPG